MVDLCTPIFDSGEAIQQRVLHDIRRVGSMTLRPFPSLGMSVGEHARFACHPGHAMPPTALTPFPRRETNIFCWRVADKELGQKVEWRLENGAPVPICEEGGISIRCYSISS
jgi:hypothetical protein